MNDTLHLVAAERLAEFHREANDRRLRDLVTACRRRILGLLPIGPACDPEPC